MAGGLDDILNNAVPGGLSKPLMAGAGQQQAQSPAPQSGADPGSLLGGLGGLLNKLSEAGHDDKVN